MEKNIDMFCVLQILFRLSDITLFVRRLKPVISSVCEPDSARFVTFGISGYIKMLLSLESD